MKDKLEYKGYSTKIEYSYEDNILFGKILGIVDSVTFECTSVDEIETTFREAVDDYLDTCKRIGKEPDKEYKGTFNIRIDPRLHKLAAIYAEKLNISLNQYVEESISRKVYARDLNTVSVKFILEEAFKNNIENSFRPELKDRYAKKFNKECLKTN